MAASPAVDSNATVEVCGIQSGIDELQKRGRDSVYPTEGHWEGYEGHWQWVFPDGQLLRGQWANINDNWYWFQGNGVAATGWLQIENLWYYFDPSNAYMHCGWLQEGGNLYYLDKDNGYARTGWLQDNGYWYYFDPTSAYMRRGWLQEGGNWYYLDKDSGYARTGWLQDNGHWYYFDPTSAHMCYGWLQEGGNWYYLDPETGAMQTGEFYIEKDKRTYFSDIHGRWVTWQFPVSGYEHRISSVYGKPRKNKRHKGLDIAAPSQTPIYSPTDGVVYKASYSETMGYYVKINSDVIGPDGANVHIRLLHMAQMSNVTDNQRVSKGQQIGYVGNTGKSTGPHLHMDCGNTEADPPQMWQCYNPASFFATMLQETSGSSANMYQQWFGVRTKQASMEQSEEHNLYKETYYTIDCNLIHLVGVDSFENWVKEQETAGQPINIISFVEHFKVPEEDFRVAVNLFDEYYSKEEIDAIYGRGDMSAFMDENLYAEEDPCG